MSGHGPDRPSHAGGHGHRGRPDGGGRHHRLERDGRPYEHDGRDDRYGRDGRDRRRGRGAAQRGVPDGLLIGIIVFLLGIAALTWSATGVAGWLAHGAWPDGVTFSRTPSAMRSLLSAPHDVSDAWPQTRAGQLPGYGLFWGVLLGQLAILVLLVVSALTAVTRWRAARWTRRSGTRNAVAPDAAAADAAAPGTTGRSDHKPGGGARDDPAGHGDVPAGQNAAGQNAVGHDSVPGSEGSPRHALPQQAAQHHPRPDATDHDGSGDAGGTPPARPEGAGSGVPSGAAPHTGTRQRPDTVPAVHSDQGRDSRNEETHRPPPGTPQVAAGAPAPTGIHGLHIGAPPALTAADAVRDADGAALVVTADPALYGDTVGARAKLGPVHVYDPTQLTDVPERLRWAPHHGCRDMAVARARARALLAPVRSPARADVAVHDAAETLLRCWLHAASLTGEGASSFRQVHRWALSGSSKDAVRILRTNSSAAGGSAGELEATLTAYPERREAATALVRRALGAVGQLHVRNACTPGRADRVAWESFVAEEGTLYLVGESIEDPHRGDPAAMPLLTALTSAVVERARQLAAQSATGRLDPPLTVVLDQPATVAPLPELPSLLADGDTTGLPTCALLRSREQVRRWWPELLRDTAP